MDNLLKLLLLLISLGIILVVLIQSEKVIEQSHNIAEFEKNQELDYINYYLNK